MENRDRLENRLKRRKLVGSSSNNSESNTSYTFKVNKSASKGERLAALEDAFTIYMAETEMKFKLIYEIISRQNSRAKEYNKKELVRQNQCDMLLNAMKNTQDFAHNGSGLKILYDINENMGIVEVPSSELNNSSSSSAWNYNIKKYKKDQDTSIHSDTAADHDDIDIDYNSDDVEEIHEVDKPMLTGNIKEGEKILELIEDYKKNPKKSTDNLPIPKFRGDIWSFFQVRKPNASELGTSKSRGTCRFCQRRINTTFDSLQYHIKICTKLFGINQTEIDALTQQDSSDLNNSLSCGEINTTTDNDTTNIEEKNSESQISNNYANNDGTSMHSFESGHPSNENDDEFREKLGDDIKVKTKGKDVVWHHFNVYQSADPGLKTKRRPNATCKYCSNEVSGEPQRLRRHLTKCAQYRMSLGNPHP